MENETEYSALWREQFLLNLTFVDDDDDVLDQLKKREKYIEMCNVCA